ncbi:hypothetical protein EG329_005163 [Mollisiaceae sp. DMI_Dod_QoI]|nr:hypothetical protein EG329_005163 [Helotiales sp. DMI_Dod_QoI]
MRGTGVVVPAGQSVDRIKVPAGPERWMASRGELIRASTVAALAPRDSGGGIFKGRGRPLRLHLHSNYDMRVPAASNLWYRDWDWGWGWSWGEYQKRLGSPVRERVVTKEASGYAVEVLPLVNRGHRPR